MKRYGSYTGIQQKAMGAIAAGDNCVIIAPTGSGKTEAAVVPVLDRLLKESGSPGIMLLYITPLRALNRDMIKRLEGMCAELGLSIAVRHGDTQQSERSRQARKAPIVMITTPETLQSILPTRSIGVALKNVKAVIIDEIHELYYNKRGAQLSLALERLEELAPGFQRIGISATVGDPELVRQFLAYGRSCRVAMVDTTKQLRLSVEIPKGHDKRLEPLISRFALDNDSLARLSSIISHIKESRSTIIFGNTRQVVEAVGSRLLYSNGLDDFGGIGVHHSSLDKKERIETENQFKNGIIKSIIATSSLELGIDIGNVDLVIQYGSPRQALRLVQRAGRSGHSEKGVSKGVIIASNQIDAMEAIAVCASVVHGKIERFTPQSNALDVLANQVSAIALDKGVVKIDDILRIANRSFSYKDLERKELVELLEFMGKQRMIGFDGVNVSSGAKTRMYYYSHLSVIPDTKRYLVKSIADNRIISSLDEGFVASSIDENSVFITKGLPWKVISIDEDIITVEPSSDLEAAVPDWSGEDIPVSRQTVENVFQMFHDKAKLQEGGFASGHLTSELSDFVAQQAKVGIPSSDEVLVELSDEYQIIHTGLGTLANEALSRIVAHRISAKTGSSVNMKSSPYMIFFEVKESISLRQMLKEISASDVEKMLLSSIEDTELFRYRFITIAKRFGIVEKDAKLSRSISKRIMKVLHGSPVYKETVRELTRNYFDTETLIWFFNGISSGKTKIRQISSKGLSPIAKLVLNSAYYSRELIMPLLPSNEIVESFSKYLLSKSIKLLCTYCGFSFTRQLSELRNAESINCPNCNSPMITQYSDEYIDVINKRKEGARLKKSEQGLMKEILKQASLFSSYGGRAALALSTYGVGPTSAARILMMLRREERFFFIDLIEAQKLFIRNKKYWSI